MSVSARRHDDEHETRHDDSAWRRRLHAGLLEERQALQSDWPAPERRRARCSTCRSSTNAFDEHDADPGARESGGGGLNGTRPSHGGRAAGTPRVTDVDYAFTTAEVIAMFNAVFPGGDLRGLKDIFEAQNQLDCPGSATKPQGRSTKAAGRSDPARSIFVGSTSGKKTAEAGSPASARTSSTPSARAPSGAPR